MHLKKNNRGFSLIEIIVVLAIMAVLVGIITPQYLRYVKKARKANDIVAAEEIGKALNILCVDDSALRDLVDMCKADAAKNGNGSNKYYYVCLYASTNNSTVPYSMKANRWYANKVEGYNETTLNNHLQQIFEEVLSSDKVKMEFLEKNTRDQWILTVDKAGRFHVLVGGGINGWQSFISNTGMHSNSSVPCYELWPYTSADYNAL